MMLAVAALWLTLRTTERNAREMRAPRATLVRVRRDSARLA